ncbi:MAG: hypothetical protein V1720_09745 [bacterium]
MKKVYVSLFCLLFVSLSFAQTSPSTNQSEKDTVKSSSSERLKIQLSPYFYTNPLDYSSRFSDLETSFILPFQSYDDSEQPASLTYDLIRSQKDLKKFMVQQSKFMDKGNLGVFGDILVTVNFAAAFGLIAAHLIKYHDGPGEDVHSKDKKKK